MRKLVGTLAAGVCMVAVAAPAQAQVRRYDIAAGSLTSALDAYARQSGRQVIYRVDETNAARSRGAGGTLSADQALDAVLAGTGFAARRDASGVVAIVRAGNDQGDSGASVEDPDQELVVTGTRIRGARVASTVITVGREDMAEAGQSSLAAVIRDIPQNFNGGQNAAVGFGVPESNGTNLGSGTGLNLRGIGSDATLTLLDGHRLAYNVANNAVDVSAIPFEAIERIELVPDGSSALYGSDAVAGVVNIVLRDRFSGVRTSARLGIVAEGAGFQQQYSALAGTDWGSGALYAAYEFSHDEEVRSDDLEFLGGKQPGLTLSPWIKHHSALVKGVQDFGDRVSFQVEALYDKRSSGRSYALNPAGNYAISGQIYRYDTESFVVAPSLKYHPGGDWQVAVNGMFGLNRSIYDGTQYANSAVSFRTLGCYCNKANSAEIVADGPLARLPAGAVKLAIGGGYRKNILHGYRTLGTAQNLRASQTAYFAFGELGVPLISEAQQSFLRSLSVSGAVRFESYPGLDRVVTPKLGVVAALNADVTLRGSWGKSFKAPTLYQQYNSLGVIVFGPATLGGGGGYPAGSTVLYLTGGNPNLKPERATTWSATLDLHPQWVPGAQLEFSYFNIDYRDRVVSPISFLSQSMSNPIYSDLVNRSPTVADVTGAVDAADLFVNASGVAFVPANVVAIVNNNNINAASQKIQGLDLLGRYKVDVASDVSAHLLFNGSYIKSSQRLSALQPATQLAGILFNPPHWRARGGATIQHKGVSLSGFVNYTGPVSDTRKPVAVRVGSMTTADLSARYVVDPGGSPLGGIELSFSVNNLFDAKPRLIATSTGFDAPYDSTNYSPLGRVVSVKVAKSW